MRTRRGAVAALLMLSGLPVVGCASHPPAKAKPAAAPAREVCDGQAYVEVKNTFETPVDVWALSADGVSRRYIGSAGPGTTRIPLLERVTNIHAETGGSPGPGRSQVAKGEWGNISFSEGCTSRR